MRQANEEQRGTHSFVDRDIAQKLQARFPKKNGWRWRAKKQKPWSLHKYKDLEPQPQTQEQDSGTNYGISLEAYQAIRAAAAEEMAMRCLLFEKSTRIMSSAYKIQGRQGR